MVDYFTLIFWMDGIFCQFSQFPQENRVDFTPRLL